MATTEYYHGSEVKEQNTTAMTVEGVDISIVGVIGTAPIFELNEENRKINELIPVNNFTESAKYLGPNISGFTLPDAVETILNESGGAKIYAVNVFDPDKHKADLETSKTFENGKITLEEKGIFNLVVKKDDTVSILDKDYSFEDNSITVIEGGALNNDSAVTISYSYADLTKITAADIIGTVDEYGKRTGIKLLEDVESVYGDSIGILIVPVYDGLLAVSNAIESFCDENDTYSYTNAPLGTTKNEAIQGRTSSGTINFNTVNKNRMLLAHYVQRYNSNEDIYEIKPLSPVFAGARVRVDRDEGIQRSISNITLKTVTGLEYPITFKNGKKDTDAQDLNSKGISCVINHNGYRTFGARSANYPSTSGIETFECCRRVDLYIKKSIMSASFEAVDKPITQGYIQSVVDSINAFLDNLKDPLRQMIINGHCWYDSALNSADELANGWVKFCYEFCPPPPAERQTYYRTINIQLLSNLGGN